MATVDWAKFAEKVRLGIESSLETHFERGLSGLELEYNVLDSELRPVTTVGFGPGRRSFSDYLMAEHIPEWARSRFQLEVFHWMTEGATRPYYDFRGTAMEGRLLEAVVINALAGAGLAFGEQFLPLHGNLPYPVEVGEESIPDGCSLAKKKYLARCVRLFGSRLATAGIHTNHSYPEALLSWDFFHLPRHRREGRTLVDFRNEAVIRATRLLRPFCPLFIAVTASTPLTWEEVNGRPEVVLTEVDSNRLLTFPNPAELDVPYLYASHQDYLRISYDLVRHGVRFGANNWTPVRARSDVDPVNRNIWATSEQLLKLYQKGLYRAGEHASLEEAEQALLVENLCARVDLPMNRVEVRTDEGGDTLEMSAAKIAFKEALMFSVYGDEAFWAGYAYDAEDVARARRNEEAAARHGLEARVEHPLTGDTVPLRAFLQQTLAHLAPLAEALGTSASLAPLGEMAAGGPNEAERTRALFAAQLRGEPLSPLGRRVVPRDFFRAWLEGRRALLRSDLATVTRDQNVLGDEQAKLGELLTSLDEAGTRDPSLPVRLAAPVLQCSALRPDDEIGEVLALSQALCRIPSVTNSPRERLEEVWRCARFIAGELKEAGAQVRLFHGGRYPAVMAGFPEGLLAPVTLGGHFDVVEPDPNDMQFEPRIEGDYLWARGAADMKTVVATTMVWMEKALEAGPPFPPINLLLVGNEENGELEPYGTPQVLNDLREEAGYAPEFMILGERTGERGDERFGEICTANRGVVRLRLVARGERGHTGVAGVPKDLSELLIRAREDLYALMAERLTLHSPDGWQTAVRFPFLSYGEPGVYNVTPGEGVLGLEIRPIPEDALDAFAHALQGYCQANGMEVVTEVMEAGVSCPEENPHLKRLFEVVAEATGIRPTPGRKLAGTSARFAPGGNAVVWGQSGIGPHTRHERHFIPSIEPYLRCLRRFAELTTGQALRTEPRR